MKSKAFGDFFYKEKSEETYKDYKKLINKSCKGKCRKAKKKVTKLMNDPSNTIFQKALDDFYKDIYNLSSTQEGSTMIHEKDYVPMDCCLCGAHMPTIHDTHNPEPLTPKCFAKDALLDNLPHRCCSECMATKVTQARLTGLGNTFNPTLLKEGQIDKDGWYSTADPDTKLPLNPKHQKIKKKKNGEGYEIKEDKDNA